MAADHSQTFNEPLPTPNIPDTVDALWLTVSGIDEVTQLNRGWGWTKNLSLTRLWPGFQNAEGQLSE
jgi:hypothetical protein